MKMKRLYFDSENQGMSFEPGFGLLFEPETELGNPSAAMIHVEFQSGKDPETAHDLARRVVASWNACAHIPIRALEGDYKDLPAVVDQLNLLAENIKGRSDQNGFYAARIRECADVLMEKDGVILSMEGLASDAWTPARRIRIADEITRRIRKLAYNPSGMDWNIAESIGQLTWYGLEVLRASAAALENNKSCFELFEQDPLEDDPKPSWTAERRMAIGARIAVRIREYLRTGNPYVAIDLAERLAHLHTQSHVFLEVNRDKYKEFDEQQTPKPWKIVGIIPRPEDKEPHFTIIDSLDGPFDSVDDAEDFLGKMKDVSPQFRGISGQWLFVVLESNEVQPFLKNYATQIKANGFWDRSHA